MKFARILLLSTICILANNCSNHDNNENKTTSSEAVAVQSGPKPVNVKIPEHPIVTEGIPINFLGFYGNGQFQDQPLPLKANGKMLQLRNVITKEDWSGFSNSYSDGMDLQNNNTLLVTVTGADTIKYKYPKFMKWYLEENIGSEIVLICADPAKISNAPEFCLPLDGSFEYPLPTKIIASGKIFKIGVALMNNCEYGDVTISANLVKR